jgi:ABC-type molybdenum transport system ATPase subunit/photorepair protein PhrA
LEKGDLGVGLAALEMLQKEIDNEPGPTNRRRKYAPPLLLLQDIIVTFGITPLLSGAELAVAAGDRVCLVGRNGSGKSTLRPDWA